MTLLAGIVGFRGYSGMELERLLSSHPRVNPIRLEHRTDTTAAPLPFGAVEPLHAPCTPEGVEGAGVKIVFLATPPEVSMELAPWLLGIGVKVIDLSGAFRLGTVGNYSRWYKEEHTQPALLAEAVYGLPEVHRDRIRTARLLSNPGCYPTAANLALRPLLQAGLIDKSAGIVCDAKSGVSGAGRKPTLKTSFCEVTENFSVYSILDHRHVPEVLMTSSLEESEFSFTAQLIPINRGILETIYFRTARGVTGDALLAAYRSSYDGEPFVRVHQPGHLPDLHAVSRSNFCDLGFRFDPPTGRTVVVAAIDNLVKGAAGQAIQNMNLMFGFLETESLL
jgi:N-acetyl-gamma-glutamyl-phosphate reductase